MINRQSSCSDIFEPGLIRSDQALNNILSRVAPVSGYEFINIEKAKGRTLHDTVTAPFNVPAHDNSAVDGYAFNSRDIPFQDTKKLILAGKILAGDRFINHLKPGQCVRIMTGAVIPAGVDTVVMQEHVEVHDGFVFIGSQHYQGENIRLAGEDLKRAETILQEGKLLLPADIGLLASIGIAEIKVRRKLRVAIASTGNELINAGTPSDTGDCYDSNRFSLLAALDRPDIEIIDLGILKDNPDTLFKTFSEAGNYADLIISSGGVSVGDADHTKTALQVSGHIDFWKLAIKPGRPMAFGHLGNSVFFGLPGNPVAVLVTFFQFVLPALEKMLGIIHKPILPTITAISADPIRKKPGRMEIVRAVLNQEQDGSWSVKTTGQQGSGILRSVSSANAFIILKHDQSTVQPGDPVTVQPFAGLM